MPVKQARKSVMILILHVRNLTLREVILLVSGIHMFSFLIRVLLMIPCLFEKNWVQSKKD